MLWMSTRLLSRVEPQTISNPYITVMRRSEAVDIWRCLEQNRSRRFIRTFHASVVASPTHHLQFVSRLKYVNWFHGLVLSRILDSGLPHFLNHFLNHLENLLRFCSHHKKILNLLKHTEAYTLLWLPMICTTEYKFLRAILDLPPFSDLITIRM